MKKLCITFLVLSLSIFQLHAYTLSDKDTRLVDTVTSIIDRKIQKKWETYKTSILELLQKIKTQSDKDTRKYELMNALIENVSELKIVTQEDLDNETLATYHANPSKMREYWLGLYNDYRRDQWLQEYSYDKRLEKTGQEWANIMLSRWKISHERTPWDGYYNYPVIEQWFQDRWVKCKVSWRTTSTEYTGYHAYYCPNWWDCTDKANEALEWIFDYYLAEKDLPFAQNSHYRTTVSPYLQYMWLGISFKDEWNGWIQIYTAAHFCTEFE